MLPLPNNLGPVLEYKQQRLKIILLLHRYLYEIDANEAEIRSRASSFARNDEIARIRALSSRNVLLQRLQQLKKRCVNLFSLHPEMKECDDGLEQLLGDVSEEEVREVENFNERLKYAPLPDAARPRTTKVNGVSVVSF